MEEMFVDIAKQLIESNRSRIELNELERLTEEASSFRVAPAEEIPSSTGCQC